MTKGFSAEHQGAPKTAQGHRAADGFDFERQAELIVQHAAAFEDMLDAIRGIQRGLEKMKAAKGEPACKVLNRIRAKYKFPPLAAMTQFEVIILPSAKRDPGEACDWIAEFDLDAAIRWYNRLTEVILSLNTFPKRCSPTPESKFFDREIREIFHGRRHTNIEFFLQ
jgi:plasmid stabilization system protein ParE